MVCSDPLLAEAFKVILFAIQGIAMLGDEGRSIQRRMHNLSEGTQAKLGVGHYTVIWNGVLHTLTSPSHGSTMFYLTSHLSPAHSRSGREA